MSVYIEGVEDPFPNMLGDLRVRALIALDEYEDQEARDKARLDQERIGAAEEFAASILGPVHFENQVAETDRVVTFLVEGMHFRVSWVPQKEVDGEEQPDKLHLYIMVRPPGGSWMPVATLIDLARELRKAGLLEEASCQSS